MTIFRKIVTPLFIASASLLLTVSFSKAEEPKVGIPAAPAEKSADIPLPQPVPVNTAPAPAALTVPAAVQPTATTPPAIEPSHVQPVKVAPRIGYVDISRIAEETLIGKSTKARFKERSSKVQAQVAAKQKQLEKQKTALEAKLPNLIPDQRRVKINEYEKKVAEFRDYLKKVEKDMLPFQEELTRAMTKETVAACEIYGSKHGLMVISVRKDLLYLGAGVETSDVTPDIIAIMDAKKIKP